MKPSWVVREELPTTQDTGEQTMTRVSLWLLVFLVGVVAARAGTIQGVVTCRGCTDQSNAIVYAERVPKEPGSPPKQPTVMDQVNLAFVPHVLPVAVGTTLSFPNSDEVRHNVFSPSSAKRFNLGTYPKGATREVTFDKPGEVALLCNVHAEMSAYVLILETPYFIVTPRDGRFTLKDLPPGSYTVTAWHERFKPVSQPVQIKGTESVTLDFRLPTRR